MATIRAKNVMTWRIACVGTICFVGFPEHAEGSHPEKFLYSWLRDIFGTDTPAFSYVIECAHDTPPRPPPGEDPPRSLIAWILNFQDKVAILHLAREKGPLKYNGNTISVYPDFSADVQHQRLSFAAVKACLHTKGLPYAMLFPAELHVIHDGKANFYTKAKEAMAWLNNHYGVLPRQMGD